MNELRERYVKETEKDVLACFHTGEYGGFQDEYVEWLEKQLLDYNNLQDNSKCFHAITMNEQEILEQFKADFPHCHKAKIVKRLYSDTTSLRFQCPNLNNGKMIGLSEVAKQIGELYSIVSDGGNGLLVEIRLN